MSIKLFRTLFILMSWALFTPSYAGELTHKQRDNLVHKMADLLDETYVYPQVGRQIKQQLLLNLSAGEYHSSTDVIALSEQLHEDVLSISQDKHMAVQHRIHIEAKREKRTKRNAQFTYESLQEGVGYLKFNMFQDSSSAFSQMKEAMEALVDNPVLIIDLRENGGGSPRMVEYLASFFFKRPTLLNTFYDRNGNESGRVKTFKHKLSEKLAGNIQLFILTSHGTFSAAEGFSYHLQAAGVAKIVGEVTGGGAHPISRRYIAHGVTVTVPVLRAYNPITKGNWEGKGVIPDVTVDRKNALDTAVKLAMQKS